MKTDTNLLLKSRGQIQQIHSSYSISYSF